MNYERLSRDSKNYVDRYCRAYGITREEALLEELVKLVIKEYEEGVNSGK